MDLDLDPDPVQKSLTEGDLTARIPGSASTAIGVDDPEVLTEGDMRALVWSRIASAALWSHWAMTGQFEEVGGRPFRFTCSPRCVNG